MLERQALIKSSPQPFGVGVGATLGLKLGLSPLTYDLGPSLSSLGTLVLRGSVYSV